VAVILAARRTVPESRAAGGAALDVPGAATFTAALAALVYGLTAAGPEGPSAAAAGACFATAAVLLVMFVVIERRAHSPLFDFALLNSRSVSVANTFAVLSTAVVVGQSFFVSLYLREVMGFSPLRTGLAMVPITLVVVAVASSIPRVLPRAGVRAVLVSAGLVLAAGMALQARIPVDGRYVEHVLPAILVTAAGLGLGFVAATIAATAGVAERQQGLASGLLNTSQQIGGSLGLAVLATIAASRTSNQLAAGAAPMQALTDGFSLGFSTAVGFALVAAAVALLAPGRSPDAVELATQRTDEPAAAGTAPALAGAPAVTPTPESDTHD
jgi:hypothetical protein